MFRDNILIFVTQKPIGKEIEVNKHKKGFFHGFKNQANSTKNRRARNCTT